MDHSPTILEDENDTNDMNDMNDMNEESIVLNIGYLSQLADETAQYDAHDQCIVPQYLWSRWIQDQEEEVLLIEIRQNETVFILCVGGSTNESTSTLFLPTRCFASLDLAQTVNISVKKTMPPLATKIELQPLDNELYHCDIATAVGKHLSNWQVLTKWTTLTVPCEELGGYLVDIFVKSIEPADTVLLRGEVPLELAAPLEEVAEWVPKQHSAPQTQVTYAKEEEGQEEGQEEDEDDPYQMIPNKASNTFVPFSGKGNRLGD
jgi:hypothetical protein